MCLQDGGARAYHFSAFAARVARFGDLRQTTMRLWKCGKVSKNPLASRLPGSIHIDDHVLLIETIPHSTWTGKGGSSLKKILKKLGAQCLDRFLIQSGEKAGKSGT